MTTPTPEHPALTAVRKSGSHKVKVAVSDIDGVLRGKYLHIDKFLGAAEPAPAGGFGFCDVVFGWYSQDNFARLQRVNELAKKRGVLPINIALAYVLNQPFPTFALIGPRMLSETRTSLPGLDVELSGEEVRWLNLQ